MTKLLVPRSLADSFTLKRLDMKDVNIHHILVPFDFSPTALNAMDTAIAIAKHQRSTTKTFITQHYYQLLKT